MIKDTYILKGEIALAFVFVVISRSDAPFFSSCRLLLCVNTGLWQCFRHVKICLLGHTGSVARALSLKDVNNSALLWEPISFLWGRHVT